MSQHLFASITATGVPVTVILGWDRPLQYFFLVVECDQEEEGYLYSNLDDPEARVPQPLSYYRAKLRELGIPVPESMFEETARDHAENTGNRRVLHQLDCVGMGR